MTNYNDGKWHGWNGGECPVHPETLISVIEDNGARWSAKAHESEWIGLRGAFRVIKEHKEPREFYAREFINIDRKGNESKPYWQECHPSDNGAILFLEVIQ